jgi:diguanylate cyclase (GGDEF)-like protein
LLASGRSELAKVEVIVTRAYSVAAAKGGLKASPDLVLATERLLAAQTAALSADFDRIGRTDGARAARARTQAQLGAAAAMLLLLAAFAWFYLRSAAARKTVEQLARQNQALLGVSRIEARTDPLTTLGNRRALASNLATAMAEPPGARQQLLVMFDLDGFKQYNDTFGHAAGDALLRRLGIRLAAAASAHGGSAYRMGGDEFCVLAHTSPDTAEKLLDDTLAALTESGDRWHVGCSYGAVWLRSEALTASDGLRLADERMYANKVGRSSASRQVTDALLQVLTEQHVALDDHVDRVDRVSELAGALASARGEPASEVARIQLAGRLHDIGKAAIPAAVLDKPGPLTDREWEFVRRHPAIGERIVLAAPALANTAEIIRSSHERIDGHGYPDGLAGDDIPIGSRIIAVCDAFDAMTSERPYRPAMSTDAALLELKRNAGTQFDATIVEEFCNTYATHLTGANVAR